MRHFLDSLKSPDVVEGLDGGRKASMQAEELILNNCSEGEVIEEFGEGLPYS